jgi:hypothetical protein
MRCNQWWYIDATFTKKRSYKGKEQYDKNVAGKENYFKSSISTNLNIHGNKM